MSDVHYNGFQYTADWASDFYFSAGFDETTSTLQVLRFSWATSNPAALEVHLSPQSVIQKLGTPDHLLASHGPTLDSITLLTVYDEGIVFEYVSDMVDPATDSRRYCFGTTEPQIINNAVIGNFYVIEPFENGLTGLSSVQDASVGASLRGRNYLPVEEVFGVAQDEIVERILAEENTCLDY